MKLFTRNNCSACENVKKALTQKAIAFEVVNIEDNYDAAMELVNSGIRSVPVLEDETGERFVGAAAISVRL